MNVNLIYSQAIKEQGRGPPKKSYRRTGRNSTTVKYSSRIRSLSDLNGKMEMRVEKKISGLGDKKERTIQVDKQKNIARVSQNCGIIF